MNNESTTFENGKLYKVADPNAFPQEPAPDWPEAVAQAAETLRSRVLDSAERDEVLDLLDRHRDAFEKREDELVAEVERLKLREAMLVNANREIREQRDALADALESCDWSYGRVQSDEVHEKINAALRLAGRLP